MSENSLMKSLDNFVSALKDSAIGFWLGLPDPGSNDEDDIWHDFELFSGEWVKIQNRKEWYESPNVPNIYGDHVYIFDKNMQMNRPEETYYKEKIDTGEFKSFMDCTEELPSDYGELRISVKIETKNPPSGENNFCMVQYLVDTELKYDVPNGITFLPRILAWPINETLKVFFVQFLAEDMIDYDGEYAIERTREYFQYIRKYHGEEPTQTKTRQAEFEPMPSEGKFFQ